MEEKGANEGRNLKKIVGAIVVIAIIIISSIIGWRIYSDNDGNGLGLIDWPSVLVNVTKENSNYTITVTDISFNSEVSLEPSWLNLTNLEYLLMSHSPVITDSLVHDLYHNNTAFVHHNETTVNKIESGKLDDNFGENSVVMFVDGDNDGKISINDYFFIKGSDLPNSTWDPQGLLSLIYKGDVDGLSNEELFIHIKYIGLKENEWWISWTW
ncbi:MAG: hypothetical protein KAR56_00500 [Thermoplasmata archaeon]|nr:hypothetical protein [Thermoplasmata archaeon]